MVIVDCLLKHGVDVNTYDWVLISKSLIVYGEIELLGSDILFHSYFYLKHKLRKKKSILSEWWDSPSVCCQRKPHRMCKGTLGYACLFLKRDYEQFPVLCYHVLFSNAAKGADMTIESDTGYTPMALAVALGHKKSMCDFLTRDNFFFTIIHFKEN